MYRLGLEAILGVHRTAEGLRIDPHIPQGWPEYEVTYRHQGTHYHIRVLNPDHVENGVKEVQLDGRTLPEWVIPFALDGQTHEVIVRMGEK
jgi:cellobiose phosphorylase